MAAPAVTGAVALYKASRPNATPAEVKEALQYLGNLNWKTSTDPDTHHEKLLDVSKLGPLGTFDLERPAPRPYRRDGGTRSVADHVRPQRDVLRAGRASGHAAAERLDGHARPTEPPRLDRRRRRRSPSRSRPARRRARTTSRVTGHQPGPDQTTTVTVAVTTTSRPPRPPTPALASGARRHRPRPPVTLRLAGGRPIRRAPSPATSSSAARTAAPGAPSRPSGDRGRSSRTLAFDAAYDDSGSAPGRRPATGAPGSRPPSRSTSDGRRRPPSAVAYSGTVEGARLDARPSADTLRRRDAGRHGRRTRSPAAAIALVMPAAPGRGKVPSHRRRRWSRRVEPTDVDAGQPPSCHPVVGRAATHTITLEIGTAARRPARRLRRRQVDARLVTRCSVGAARSPALASVR